MMFIFNSDCINQKYPEDRSKVLLTDAKSLAHSIQTRSFYKYIYLDKNLFDFLGYDKTTSAQRIKNNWGNERWDEWCLNKEICGTFGKDVLEILMY